MQKVKCFKIGIYIFKRFFAKSVNLKIYSLFCIPKKKKKIICKKYTSNLVDISIKKIAQRWKCHGMLFISLPAVQTLELNVTYLRPVTRDRTRYRDNILL